MSCRLIAVVCAVLLPAAAQAQGIILTVAGGGTPNTFCGDGGRASASCVSTPMAVSVDRDGNRYFADKDNQRIRRWVASRPRWGHSICRSTTPAAAR